MSKAFEALNVRNRIFPPDNVMQLLKLSSFIILKMKVGLGVAHISLPITMTIILWPSHMLAQPGVASALSLPD